MINKDLSLLSKQRWAVLIKETRTKLDLTQLEFGALIDTAVGTIGNWESEQTAPRERYVDKLAKVRGQDPSILWAYLVGETSVLPDFDADSAIAKREGAITSLLDIVDALNQLSFKELDLLLPQVLSVYREKAKNN